MAWKLEMRNPAGDQKRLALDFRHVFAMSLRFKVSKIPHIYQFQVHFAMAALPVSPTYVWLGFELTAAGVNCL